MATPKTQHHASNPVEKLAAKAATTDPQTAKISAKEQRRRASAFKVSAHSAALEGQYLSPEAIADSEAYVRGDLTIDELGQRTRERYGVV